MAAAAKASTTTASHLDPQLVHRDLSLSLCLLTLQLLVAAASVAVLLLQWQKQ